MRWSLVFLILFGCREPTQITFEITTDRSCSSVNGTAISVGTLGQALDSKPPGSLSMQCNGGNLGTLVVTPSDVNAELAVRVVTGVGKSAEDCIAAGFKGGCIVARRALRFLAHEKVRVPIAMDASCIDIPCGPTESCVKGQCVDVHSLCTSNCPNPDGGMMPTPGWKPMSAGPLSPRQNAIGAALSKRRVLVWGGYVGGSYTDDGAIYDASSNTWSPKVSAPPNKMFDRGDAFAFTLPNDDVVIWGGVGVNDGFTDGAIYHPNSDTWDYIAESPLVKRTNGATVYADTTNEILTWSGSPDGDANAPFDDGARYSFALQKWTLLPMAPITARTHTSAIFAGGKMVIYGGVTGSMGVGQQDFATFDPQSNMWQSGMVTQVDGRNGAFVANVNGQALFWGGDYNISPGGMDGLSDGFVLDPNGTFAGKIPSPGAALAPPIRNAPNGWISGGRMWIWGGLSDVVSNNGASYDIAGKTWTPMPASLLTPRDAFVSVWTGTEVVIWGGYDATGIVGDGATFTP